MTEESTFLNASRTFFSLIASSEHNTFVVSNVNSHFLIISQIFFTELTYKIASLLSITEIDPSSSGIANDSYFPDLLQIKQLIFFLKENN